jgi:dipeptidyl aminopeptidase/acylaminoacyl peptidase
MVFRRCAVIALISLGMPLAAAADDVRAYARAPVFALPSLSPNGASLSHVEQNGDRQTVVIRTISDGTTRRTLSLESKHERVRWCDWSGNDVLLCGTLAPARAPDRITETTRLYAVDVSSGRIRNLSRTLRGSIVDFDTAGRAGRVLLQHDPSGRGYPQVSELDVETGDLRTAVRARPPVRRWMSDGKGTVRLGIGYEGGKGSLLVRRDASDDWRTLLEQSLQDLDALAPLAFGADPSELFVLKHHNGRVALFRLTLDRPDAPALLFADDVYDVDGPVILHPKTHALLAVQYVDDSTRRHFFDPVEALNAAWLNERLPGAVNLIIDRSTDNGLQLVLSGSDIEPPSLYLFDTQGKRLSLIGHNYRALEEKTLAPMRPIVYRARDGQAIPAYLTLPVGASSDLPTIVLPHGGPETRTAKGFDPLVQFLAAQGYAVLQMNYRGSLGYGARFAAAGVGQWGGLIHNDITDGARWLIEERIADPTRVCIVGSSFGGYAALLGAARESQWYACAASFAGVSDLLAMAQYTERLQDAEIWRLRLGESARALWHMSPIARARAVETPVWMMHGRYDAVVPFGQSRRFARALRQSGKEHHFVERSDCDHEMTIESCRIAFFENLARFLDDHLQ